MNSDERTVLIATAGLLTTAVGALLPWARIGGRSRSGFSTADTFIGLAEGVLPDAVAWVGRWWYAPAILAMFAWATAFTRGRLITRIASVLAVVIALGMWWLFVWAGANWDVLDTQLTGPLVASAGLSTIAIGCLQTRDGLVANQR